MTELNSGLVCAVHFYFAMRKLLLQDLVTKVLREEAEVILDWAKSARQEAAAADSRVLGLATMLKAVREIDERITRIEKADSERAEARRLSEKLNKGH